MRNRASSALPVIAVAAALGAIARPGVARADGRPTVATDGFYVGVRADPGWALVGGWDLDVYLQRNRSISLGPAVSVAVLASAGSNEGRLQDILVSVDLLRLKVGPTIPGGVFRPFIALGGGVSYARLPAQMSSSVTIVTDSGMTVTGTRSYPAMEEFSPLLTVGAGTDVFLDGPLGASVQMLTHFHPLGSSRVPDEWYELAVGIRFGI